MSEPVEITIIARSADNHESQKHFEYTPHPSRPGPSGAIDDLIVSLPADVRARIHPVADGA